MRAARLARRPASARTWRGGRIYSDARKRDARMPCFVAFCFIASIYFDGAGPVMYTCRTPDGRGRSDPMQTADAVINRVRMWTAAWERVQASHDEIDRQYNTRGRCTRAAIREMTRATRAFSAACRAMCADA